MKYHDFKTDDPFLMLAWPTGWRVMNDIMITFRGPTVRRMILIRKNFKTDLATIPRIGRGLLDRNGRSRMPAILHDWLYFTGDYGNRRDCDRMFRDYLRESGIKEWRVQLYYYSVRLFGHIAWNKRRQNDE